MNPGRFHVIVHYQSTGTTQLIRPSLDGLRYMELGPGADFAPQLVLASHGVQVTLADKYLSNWDSNYHPEFYRAFLAQWSGRK